MNDEIKEILDYLAFLEDVDIQKKVKKVADYITNLQQERDKFKLRCYKAKKMIWDNYGVLDKYGIEMLEDILDGRSDE